MSICLALDALIDHALGVTHIGTTAPHYAHKGSAVYLSQHPVEHFDASLLVRQMVECMAIQLHATSHRPSPANWRWEKQQYLVPTNRSPEKIFEKQIVAITGPEWVNQVPTAAGLLDATSDTHRNIDLVHRLQPGEYECIELKIQSDTPLKAMIELLHYAALYLLTLRHYTETEKQAKALLQAERLHWRVLAPRHYYTRFNLGWLASKLHTGLGAYCLEERLPLVMSFACMEFGVDCLWDSCSDQACFDAIHSIRAAGWC